VATRRCRWQTGPVTDVQDRIALVTGGASGIGRALALELARRGAVPVVWDVDGERLASVVEQLRRVTGGKAFGYACDVRDPAAVRRAAGQVRHEVGDVEVLVNNAGVVSGARLDDIPDEMIRRTFDVNVLGLFWVTRAFLPAMLEANRGHIVTVASAAGLVGVARQTDYSASKHAAVGFDESLRVELHRIARRIVTTVVCPYYIDTGMFNGVKTRVPFLLPILGTEDVARKIADAIARNRRVLVMPPIIRLLPVLRALPPTVFDRIMDLFGVNASMDHFRGRGGAPAPGTPQLATDTAAGPRPEETTARTNTGDG
jgi:all-trans-retinol dehydrogenase (NAD+)